MSNSQKVASPAKPPFRKRQQTEETNVSNKSRKSQDSQFSMGNVSVGTSVSNIKLTDEELQAVKKVAEEAKEIASDDVSKFDEREENMPEAAEVMSDENAIAVETISQDITASKDTISQSEKVVKRKKRKSSGVTRFRSIDSPITTSDDDFESDQSDADDEKDDADCRWHDE